MKKAFAIALIAIVAIGSVEVCGIRRGKKFAKAKGHFSYKEKEKKDKEKQAEREKLAAEASKPQQQRKS